jgi:hypothetical protein
MQDRHAPVEAPLSAEDLCAGAELPRLLPGHRSDEKVETQWLHVGG